MDSGKRQFQIQGHRGGYKPDNVLSTFQKSLDNGLEAIELDVWHTKDKVLVVAHGGDDGNLKDYGRPEDYIYDWTLEQLQTLDAGEGNKIPTLEEVFKLFDKQVFINIELKGPRTAEFKKRYDCALAAQLVSDLVHQYEYHGRFLVSSFNADILEEIERMRLRVYGGRISVIDGAPSSFDIIYLYNYENQPLPEREVYTKHGDGINISANYISKEVVDAVHESGKKIGVWIRAKDYKETDEFYGEMFNLGVDFICADMPLRAMAAREEYFAKLERPL
ncbi:hypothetical protein FGO68_gene13413 [Halteria grandinella]|uniref:GP-PDE domain-containing protein n=1 Tax=Halteria grandinella TaxID=5974 RepID=A0A8J8NJV0_HALGN|nr:hypothetical protein FGO68_gene13413 [Halteria grandinella]